MTGTLPQAAPSRRAPTKAILPDFIVIGAMKAGTTMLYRHLAAHPEIGMSRMKETDFFIAERNYERGFRWYSSQFEPGKRLYGEASPNYTKARDFPGVAARIAGHLPDVKLIYIVRDPVDRFVSQYMHSFLSGALRERPEELVGGHEWSHILDASLYHRQWRRYADCFPEKQILTLDFDELTVAPATAIGRIGAFLDLPDLRPAEKAEAANTRDAVASTPTFLHRARRLGITEMVRPMVPAAAERRLKALLSRGAKKRVAPPFPEELRVHVADALREDIAAFRKATGRSFPQWRV